MNTNNTRKIKNRNKWQITWFRFRKNKLAMLGLFILLGITLITIYISIFADYNNAIEQNVRNRYLSPSVTHLFGTDYLGRSILWRILFGSRISLYCAVFTVAASLIVGAMVGSTAGFFGGQVDNILMRIIDVFMAIPTILLAIAIVAALGTSLFNMLLALSISQVPSFARIVRSAILTVKEQDYIEAARACGTSNIRIIMKHVLPNAMAPIIVQATLSVASVILLIAALSFLGLGIQPPTPEWGYMITEGKAEMRTYPYLVIIPGIAIALVVFSLNLFGDGLRDALDPKLKN